MRALLAKLKGPWLFVRYIEEFAKNHVRKNEGQLYRNIRVTKSRTPAFKVSKLTESEKNWSFKNLLLFFNTSWIMNSEEQIRRFVTKVAFLGGTPC